MRINYTYPVILSDGGDGFWLATCPDVPEAHTDDMDRQSAIDDMEGALIAALDAYIDLNRLIPKPTRPKEAAGHVALPPLIAAKLALFELMRKQGMSKVDLAKRLSVSENSVRRLLDLAHSSKIEKLERALATLGHEIHVGVRPIDHHTMHLTHA